MNRDLKSQYTDCKIIIMVNAQEWLDGEYSQEQKNSNSLKKGYKILRIWQIENAISVEEM